MAELVFSSKIFELEMLLDNKDPVDDTLAWIGTAWIGTKLLPLRWRHNERDSVSNHQPHDCLLNRLFRRRSKKTSKLRVTGLCVGNSPGTGEFPAQMASYAENVSIWWRHHTRCGMETISSSRGESTSHRQILLSRNQWCGTLLFFYVSLNNYLKKIDE